MFVFPANTKKGGSIVTRDNLQITMADVNGDKVRPAVTTRVAKKVASLPKVRKKKVLTIRHQLAEGKYCIKERMNVALDRLIEHLITK